MGARTRGFIEIVGPEGRIEIPTITCAHCNGIVAIPKGAPEVGFCHKCMEPTCVPCGQKACDVFAKKLLRAEAREALRRSAGV